MDDMTTWLTDVERLVNVLVFSGVYDRKTNYDPFQASEAVFERLHDDIKVAWNSPDPFAVTALLISKDLPEDYKRL